MRLRIQSPLVLETSTPMGERVARALLALWRAALLSATIYFVVEGSFWLDYQEMPLRPTYHRIFKVAAALEWLPYRVGKIVPALRAPSGIVQTCGYEAQLAVVMFLPGSLEQPSSSPSSHILIGNFTLFPSKFRQHMKGSTLTYFIVFLGLAELRMRWRRWREARAPR